ncbi:MAG: hypothetical protein KDC98_18830 [Planctomycetes bacterium]|nr:hypothetical protein [Planctomycetota bacterium]
MRAAVINENHRRLQVDPNAELAGSEREQDLARRLLDFIATARESDTAEGMIDE